MSEVNNHHNVIVFGQTGIGKSSLINMLARKVIAGVSRRAAGCTSSNESYTIRPPVMEGTANEDMYTFWDTPGLNEGEQGTVPPKEAFKNLLNLVISQTVNLLIYCIRGSRFTEIVRVNYDLFWGIICEGRVPIVLVVTGLEQEQDIDQWWTENYHIVQRMGMQFMGYACVTTTKGSNDIYAHEYLKSAEKVWSLVKAHCNRDPCGMQPEWLSGVPDRMEKYMRRYNARTGKERDVLPAHLRPAGPLAVATSWFRVPSSEQASSPKNDKSPVGFQNKLPDPPNIVVCGPSGSGKSSLINTLSHRNIVNASTDLSGCQCYDISSPYRSGLYRFWDTPGFVAGKNGTLLEGEELYELFDKGVNLVILCIGGGSTTPGVTFTRSYFWQIIWERKVPIVLVVTGLGHERDMDEWWRLNKKVFEGQGITFQGRACVTTKGVNGAYEVQYWQSIKKVWELVQNHCDRKPWRLALRIPKIYHPRTGIPFIDRLISRSPSATGGETDGGLSSTLALTAVSPRQPVHNIILFGETGSETTSFVNKVLNDEATDVTKSSCVNRYQVPISENTFSIYDTTRLYEPVVGPVADWKAIEKLYTLIRGLDGISLLIFCLRPRLRPSNRATWILFNKVLCGEEVPAIAVVPAENRDKDELNEFSNFVQDTAGVLPIPSGWRNEEWQRCRAMLLRLIEKRHRGQPWSLEKDARLDCIYQKSNTMKFGFLPRIGVEFVGSAQSLIDEVIKETGMSSEDSKRLKVSFLKAEKKAVSEQMKGSRG